jgi:hypothetical protein
MLIKNNKKVFGNVYTYWVQTTEAFARPMMVNTSLEKKKNARAKVEAKAAAKQKKEATKAATIKKKEAEETKKKLQKANKDAALQKKAEVAKQKAEIEKWKRHSVEDRKILVSYIDDLKKEISKLKQRN